MTTNNLTLIFTPAVFQDLNHAQHSPGEWAKDCVLEDLIVNCQDIFANKDLHNNSAITGHIQYGFDNVETPDESAHHINRYAMKIQSPDSPTGTVHTRNDEDDYSFVDEEEDSDFITSVHDGDSSNSSSILHLHHELLPKRSSSRSNTPSPPLIAEKAPMEQAPIERAPIERARVEQAPIEQQAPPVPTHTTTDTPSRSGSFERRKYQAHFQEKGLKVDTGSSASLNVRDGRDHHIPVIKSATVPSYDWLKFDPENSNNPPVPAVPKLRRSATTGKKVISRRKMSTTHHQDELHTPPALNRRGNHSTSTANIP